MMKKFNTISLQRLSIALVVTVLAACGKNKQDIRPGNLPTYDYTPTSSTRVINLNSPLELMLNNIKLTNWIAPKVLGVDAVPSPTPYFPVSGKFTGAYYLPQQFFDGNNQSVVKILSPQVGISPVLIDSFKVDNNYKQPYDYYTATATGSTASGYTFTRVPRGVTAPAKPTNIRIRLVNLSMASNGDKLSLAYADGTPVNTLTSGLSDHTWSDYIEIPYGTYQFKVLTDGKDTQQPGKPPVLTQASSGTDFSLSASQVYYAPVQTYQPGGVYTIVISNTSGYQYGDSPLPANCFSVITDLTPQANVIYSRLQVINTVAESGIRVQIDDAPSFNLTYATASDYAILIKGRHTIRVTDASGAQLVQQSVNVNGGDNFSLWVYPKANGAAITVVQNNMGGVRSTQSNSDGSDNGLGIYNPLNFNMLVQTRFLNFCVDIPYVTFTNIDGTLFADGQFSNAAAALNLQPGQSADPGSVSYPYIDLSYLKGGVVQAYRSAPQVVPGDRLMAVTPLQTSDFVRMPSRFFNNGRYIAEPGVYTVALIGRNSGSSHPKLIVIKHNR